MGRIAQWLKEFKSQGYRPTDITILSFRSADACAAMRLKDEGFKLRPAWQASACTGYTSIHAFKGMENKVVILTDLVPDEQDFHRHLLYTGMTRATESVRVSCAKNAQEHLVRWLSGKAEG